MKTVIIGKMPTQVNIKEQLEQLITEYHQVQRELADGCRLAKSQLLTNAQTELYTPEGLREQYNRQKDGLIKTGAAVHLCRCPCFNSSGFCVLGNSAEVGASSRVGCLGFSFFHSGGIYIQEKRGC